MKVVELSFWALKMRTFILVLLINIGSIVLSLGDRTQKLFLLFCASRGTSNTHNFFCGRDRTLKPCCVCHNVMIAIILHLLLSSVSQSEAELSAFQVGAIATRAKIPIAQNAEGLEF